MEEYGLDELAASAEAVVARLGPLAAGLARLAVEASRAVTLEAMEGRVVEQGQKLLCGLIQLQDHQLCIPAITSPTLLECSRTADIACRVTVEL